MEFRFRPCADDRLALGPAKPHDASWRETLRAWQAGAGAALGDCLAKAPYRAAYWESPPLTPGGLDAPFEGVIIDAPPLAEVTPEPEVFAEHFDDAPVATFDNLGSDAVLIAPAPVPGTDASHLLAFCRSAPAEQSAELFRVVATTLGRVLDDQAPTWLSTSGLGVAWLHVRLDARPKYYQHAPYRRWRRGKV